MLALSKITALPAKSCLIQLRTVYGHSQWPCLILTGFGKAILHNCFYAKGWTEEAAQSVRWHQVGCMQDWGIQDLIITQSQHQAYNAGKLTIYSHNFKAYQFSWSSFYLVIPLCWLRSLCVLSDNLLSEFKAFSIATTQWKDESYFLNKVAIT